jgi:putative ABC transport system permease protein
MSLMIANVRDRVTEIGLRRAMGASRWDIALLFVIEACLITFMAAVTATLATHMLLLIGRNAFPVPLSLGYPSILIPILVALLLGIISSYWPAKSAAEIMPSEALRNE